MALVNEIHIDIKLQITTVDFIPTLSIIPTYKIIKISVSLKKLILHYPAWSALGV